jgi:Hypoxia induced protein conserved region
MSDQNKNNTQKPNAELQAAFSQMPQIHGNTQTEHFEDDMKLKTKGGIGEAIRDMGPFAVGAVATGGVLVMGLKQMSSGEKLTYKAMRGRVLFQGLTIAAGVGYVLYTTGGKVFSDPQGAWDNLQHKKH